MNKIGNGFYHFTVRYCDVNSSAGGVFTYSKGTERKSTSTNSHNSTQAPAQF